MKSMERGLLTGPSQSSQSTSHGSRMHVAGCMRAAHKWTSEAGRSWATYQALGFSLLAKTGKYLALVGCFEVIKIVIKHFPRFKVWVCKMLLNSALRRVIREEVETLQDSQKAVWECKESSLVLHAPYSWESGPERGKKAPIQIQRNLEDIQNSTTVFSIIICYPVLQSLHLSHWTVHSQRIWNLSLIKTHWFSDSFLRWDVNTLPCTPA